MTNENDLLKNDIESYLKAHENKELLRFITCGSVDDGKSTLIGRLLHDSKMIFEDQLKAIEQDSKKVGTTGEQIDLALLVDGLASEREQGITIDVAYRYFATDKRKFIIADTPGHEQYTRNMATGASTADLAIILIDARYGVATQTKRHSFIVSLLGIKKVIVAINKMDLVDFSEDVFNKIKSDYIEFAKDLNIKDTVFAPISALNGDNVVTKSDKTPWFAGEPLIKTLENIEIVNDSNFENFRFPVQYVNRPNLNFRGFSGTIASGEIAVGDEVVALPSYKKSKVKEIVTYDGNLESAFAQMAVTITLEDEIDISRGDMIVKSDDVPILSRDIDVNIVWMNEKALELGKSYYIKKGTNLTQGVFEKVYHKKDVNTLEELEADKLELNEIALAKLTLSSDIAFDSYNTNRATGSFIVVDRITNNTIGAGMIVAKSKEKTKRESLNISEFEIEFNALIRKHFPHWEAKDVSEFFKNKG